MASISDDMKVMCEVNGEWKLKCRCGHNFYYNPAPHNMLNAIYTELGVPTAICNKCGTLWEKPLIEDYSKIRYVKITIVFVAPSQDRKSLETKELVAVVGRYDRDLTDWVGKAMFTSMPNQPIRITTILIEDINEEEFNKIHEERSNNIFMDFISKLFGSK